MLEPPEEEPLPDEPPEVDAGAAAGALGVVEVALLVLGVEVDDEADALPPDDDDDDSLFLVLP